MIAVNYNASVLTPAGWRGVVFRAEVERVSAKRVRVVRVVAIDGEPVTRVMSRTGSNRQKFNGAYFAGREAGKIKNIAKD